MTLRVLQYRAFCGLPEEREFRRAEAQMELDSLVREDMQDAATWHEYAQDEFYVISWSIRMEDDQLLRALDD